MFRRYLLTGFVAGFLSISSTLYPVKLTDTRGVKEYVESFLFNGVYAAESEIILKDNTTASGLTVKEETANTTIARFRGDGNVGIGTAGPNYPLEIKKSGGTVLGGDTGLMVVRDTSGDKGFHVSVSNTEQITRFHSSSAIGYTTPTGFAFITADGSAWAERLRIHTNGNVGIGTTVPSRKFSVSEAGTPFMSFMDGSTEKWAIGHTTTGTAGFTFFSGDHRVKITEAGNVGIGTTAPVEKSTIVTTDATPGLLVATTSAQVGGNTSIRLGYNSATSGGTDNWANFRLRNVVVTGGGADAFLEAASAVSSGTAIWNTNQLVLLANGNVGIGTPSPQHPLHMGSGAHVTTGGVWTNASSREYKKNIRDLTVDDAMQALDGLRPSRFNYKVDDEDEYVGFIAEDVPELVATRDRKGLSPMDLTAVLTKVVQEQQKMLQTQKEAMDGMKHEIEMLKSAMNYGVKGL